MHLLKIIAVTIFFGCFILNILTSTANASECLDSKTVLLDTDSNPVTPSESMIVFVSSNGINDCFYILSTDEENQALQDLVANSSNSTQINYDLLGITPELIAQVFGFGFGAVIFFWSLGYAVGIATGVIKKV